MVTSNRRLRHNRCLFCEATCTPPPFGSQRRAVPFELLPKRPVRGRGTTTRGRLRGRRAGGSSTCFASTIAVFCEATCSRRLCTSSACTTSDSRAAPSWTYQRGKARGGGWEAARGGGQTARHVPTGMSVHTLERHVLQRQGQWCWREQDRAGQGEAIRTCSSCCTSTISKSLSATMSCRTRTRGEASSSG